jgi:hypothetical protein
MPPGIQRWARQNVLQQRPLLITEEALTPKLREACAYLEKHIGKEHLGDYLEFGVFNGTSLGLMYKVLQEFGFDTVHLFGFDSFEGLPADAATDDEGAWQPGQYFCNLKTTQHHLNQRGIDWSRTFLVKGWFSETLQEQTVQAFRLRKASIIMVDCDLYTSTCDVLRFCTPLIQDQTFVIFDDWNSFSLADRNLGERKAFEEFLTAHSYMKAEDFGTYNWKDAPNGRMFLVTNTKSKL